MTKPSGLAVQGLGSGSWKLSGSRALSLPSFLPCHPSGTSFCSQVPPSPCWRRKCQPPSIFIPGKSHGQRSLVGYSPWGHKESNTTEWLNNKTPPEHLWFLYFSATGLHCVWRKGERRQSCRLALSSLPPALPAFAGVCVSACACVFVVVRWEGGGGGLNFPFGPTWKKSFPIRNNKDIYSVGWLDMLAAAPADCAPFMSRPSP